MFDAIMLFIFGLLLLIKGGDWFVDSATGIAHRFRVPELIIGATIVSIGTTLPEVMVSATSAFQGHGEIAYGNAIGSIICNTALIAAITIAVRPPEIDRKTFTLPVIFFFIAAIMYMIVAYLFDFTRLVGIILLVVFAIYMGITIWRAVVESKKARALLPAEALGQASQNSARSEEGQVGQANAAEARQTQNMASSEETIGEHADINITQTQQTQNVSKTQDEGPKDPKKEETIRLVKNIVMLIVGAALIALGANLLVNNGIKIAEWIGVPESVIALTFVALGTSLPELVTAITSLIKKHGSLSLGNIIGANLFNLVLVSGVAITIAPFAVPSSNTVFGINSSFIIDLPVMLFVMMFLTLPAIIRGKLSRWQGITLLAVYAAFCVIQFVI